MNEFAVFLRGVTPTGKNRVPMADLRAVLKKNPFPIKYQKQTYFTMLKGKPEKKKLTELLLLDFSPDRVEVIGDVVYTCYNTTLSDSKFHNNFYERKMSAVATTRNFNTMMRVFELLREK